jgi:hypothetical protein
LPALLLDFKIERAHGGQSQRRLTGLHAGDAAYGTIVDMNKRSNSRPSWVWAALALQLVLLSLTAYGCVQVLALWSRYAPSGMGAQLAVRVFFPAAMVAVSLIGLWRTRRWGWILALVADGALCTQTLWFLLDYATRAVRNARWLAFNIWEFAALAILLYRPVRDHFLQRNRVPRKATTPLVHAESGVHQAGKLLRILVYFSVAVVAVCVVTAFSLALFMGQKNGGSRGFGLFLLWPYDWLRGIIPFPLDPYFGGSQAWPGAVMAVAAAWGIAWARRHFRTGIHWEDVCRGRTLQFCLLGTKNPTPSVVAGFARWSFHCVDLLRNLSLGLLTVSSN